MMMLRRLARLQLERTPRLRLRLPRSKFSTSTKRRATAATTTTTATTASFLKREAKILLALAVTGCGIVAFWHRNDKEKGQQVRNRLKEASSLKQRGNLDEASRATKDALELLPSPSPTRASALTSLGDIALARSGGSRTKAALEEYERALAAVNASLRKSESEGRIGESRRLLQQRGVILEREASALRSVDPGGAEALYLRALSSFAQPKELALLLEEEGDPHPASNDKQPLANAEGMKLVAGTLFNLAQLYSVQEGKEAAARKVLDASERVVLRAYGDGDKEERERHLAEIAQAREELEELERESLFRRSRAIQRDATRIEPE